VLVSGVTEALTMLRIALLDDPTERRLVEGMPELLRDIAGAGPVFYVSTSPWNLHTSLTSVLTDRGLPPGPLLLTDWGISRRQLLQRDTLGYKVAAVERLLEDFPGRGVVLLGDRGSTTRTPTPKSCVGTRSGWCGRC
jgi:phosphatidate phosphatase APP1